MHTIHHPKTFWVGAASLMVAIGITAGYVLQDWSQLGALPHYGVAFRSFSFLLVLLGTTTMFAARHQLRLRREREDLLTLIFILGALDWIMGAVGLVFPLDYKPLAQQHVMVFFSISFLLLGGALTTLGVTGGQKTTH